MPKRRRYRTKKIGAKRFYILPKRRNSSVRIFHYMIGNRSQTDTFYDDVKAHLSVTDLVMRRKLGKRLKKPERPRFAYQVLPSVYDELNSRLKAECSATSMPTNWNEFEIEDL